jgi:hypothetical protein
MCETKKWRRSWKFTCRNPARSRAELLEEIGALLEGSRISATGLLNLQLRTHLLDLRRRLRNGERLPVTTDQAARAADRLIQAERKQGELELLGVLGAAVGAWGAAALESAEPVLEIEAAEVIEGSS